MADAARRAGQAAEAQRDRALAGERIEAMRRAGFAPRLLAITLSRLAAYDGREDEAVALLAPALPTFPFPRAELEWPLQAGLLRRPGLQSTLGTLDTALTAQRAQVVAMLCGPQRLSATWQPAPETCAIPAPVR
jgi:hypothetical protein